MKMMFLLFSSLLIPPLWALPNGEPQTFDEDQERTTSQIVLTARGGRLPDPGGFAAGRVSSSGRRYNVPEYPSLIGGSPPGYNRPRPTPSYHLYDATGQGHGNVVPGYNIKPFSPQFGR